MTHLGDVAAALVDGELGHAARERALRHLTACGRCRAEVDAQRALKASLHGSAVVAPVAHDALRVRLLALPVADTVRSGALAGDPPAPCLRRPDIRPAVPLTGPPPEGPHARRRVVTGAGALVVGTVVLVLGVSHDAAPPAPLPPAGGSLVTQSVRGAADAPVLGDTRSGPTAR